MNAVRITAWLGFCLIARGAGAASVCEQLILPGLEAVSLAPVETPKLNIGRALTVGKRLARMSDSNLIHHLETELAGDLFVVGAGLSVIREALNAGQFGGVAPTPARRAQIARLVEPRDREVFAGGKFIVGLTRHDFASADELRVQLSGPREVGRVEAQGQRLRLTLDLDPSAPGPEGFGDWVDRDGMRRALKLWPSSTPELITPASAAFDRVDEETIEAILERRGFLLIFRKSAFANRLHYDDPESLGSIVTIARGRGLTEADLYAIIPQSAFDLADLQASLAELQNLPRKVRSGRRPTAPPARVVVPHTRARRS